MADIECPSCGTLLRNAQAGPDGHIRCLNCGKRFAFAETVAAVAPAASAASAASAAPAAPETPSGSSAPSATSAPSTLAGTLPGAPAPARAGAAPSRKPAAGSYGLVMVLGYLFLLAGIVLGIVLGYGTLDMLAHLGRFGTGISEIAMMASVTLALPCLGLSGLLLLRRLAPIDAAAVQLAWRHGALFEGMPQTPGSSLPYILPLTAGGGLLAIVPILISSEHRPYGGGLPMEAALMAIPAGALLVLLGLALGELRRFLWRLEFAANALAERLEAAPNRFRTHPPGHYGLGGVILLCAATTATVSMLAALSDMSRGMNRKAFSFWLTMVLLFPGGILSLGLLTQAAGRTLAAWYRALHALAPGARRHGGPTGPSQAISHLFLWFSIFWAGLLPVTVLYAVMDNRSGVRFDDDFVGMMSATLTASLAAVWLATLFGGVYRARALVDGALDGRSASQADRAAEASPARMLKWALLAEAAVVLVCLMGNLPRREWFLFLLMMSGLAYVPLWLGFAADEMRMLAIEAQLLANAEPPPAAPGLSNVPPDPPYA